VWKLSKSSGSYTVPFQRQAISEITRPADETGGAILVLSLGEKGHSKTARFGRMIGTLWRNGQTAHAMVHGRNHGRSHDRARPSGPSVPCGAPVLAASVDDCVAEGSLGMRSAKCQVHGQESAAKLGTGWGAQRGG